MTVRIGLIVPCDLTLDAEYWDLVPPGVSVHITRTGFHDGGLDLEFVRGVGDPEELAYATRSLSKIDPAVIAFACTSGSFVNGLDGERHEREILLANGARRALTTSGSLVEALTALGIRRVALGTPYIGEIADRLPPFLVDAGFEPVSIVNMELHDVIGDIADDEVTTLAEAAYRPDAEAIFLACTGVPTLDAIAPLEARYGIPVLSANQVTMWAALRAAGVTGIPPAVAAHRLFDAGRPSRAVAEA